MIHIREVILESLYDLNCNLAIYPLSRAPDRVHFLDHHICTIHFERLIQSTNNSIDIWNYNKGIIKVNESLLSHCPLQHQRKFNLNDFEDWEAFQTLLKEKTENTRTMRVEYEKPNMSKMR